MVRESSATATTATAAISQAWRRSTTPSRTTIMSSRQGLARSGKVLDTWHRYEDSEGSVYFVQPLGNYMGDLRRDDRSARAVVSLPVQIQQRIVPSGYSPNRFPVMPHRMHTNGFERMVIRSADRETPVPCVLKGRLIAVDKSKNHESSQRENDWSSMYFGEESTVSSCSVPSVYENVPKSAKIFVDMNDCGTEVEHLLNCSFPSNSRVTPAEKDIKHQIKSKTIWEGGSNKKTMIDGVLAPTSGIEEKKAKKTRRKPSKFFRLFTCCCMGPIDSRKVTSDVSDASSSSKSGGNVISINSNSGNTGSPLAYDGVNSIITQVTKDSLKNSCINGGPSNNNEPFSVDDNDYRAPLVENLLLPPLRQCDVNKKCLIVDLDETLVHSSFKPVKNPDFVIPVEIGNTTHQVYVLKRPYVDVFLEKIGDKFECVLFTASLAKYADPVANLLDKKGVFRSRLFREACVFYKGNYVKDLTRLGRELKKIIIIDNSPASYSFHPENAIPVHSWFSEETDTELLDILPLLDELVDVDNIYPILRNYEALLQRSSPTHSETNLAS